MNKSVFILILGFIVIAAGCKGKRGLIETANGTVEIYSPKKARFKITEKPLPPQWVKMVASVTVTQNGSEQGATADIRMRQDSIMWVELADPFIGLKVIRAFAMADTVAFVNRIDRTYFTGSYQKVEQKLGTSIPFPFIFNVFQGQLFEQNWKVDVVESNYILLNQDEENSFMATVEPFYFDVVNQKYITPADVLTATYGDYRSVNGYRFPFRIKVEVKGRENLRADFEVKSVEIGGPLKTPFKISSKYERME